MRLKLVLCEEVFLRWLNAQARRNGLWDDSLLTRRLRSATNTFLASGMKACGAEEPRARCLPIGSEARDVLLKWTELQRGSVTWHPEKGFEIADTVMGLDEWSGKDDCGSRTEIEAARQFACFMDSDARWRLVRCKRCGTYALPKALRLKVYKRGWRCRKCVHKASAIVATSKRRKDRREQIDECAAQAVQEWKRMPRKPRGYDQVSWVTKKVNDQLIHKGLDTIARNTVTHFLKNRFSFRKRSLKD